MFLRLSVCVCVRAFVFESVFVLCVVCAFSAFVFVNDLIYAGEANGRDLLR